MRETRYAASCQVETEKRLNQCVLCENVKMRRDICGTYCGVGATKNPDGSCDKWELHR